MRRATQVTGGLTAAYGVFVLAAPGVFARQIGYDAPGGPTSAVRILTASLGVRDVISGVAMVVAPPGGARLLALGVRCLSDAGDAVIFGTMLPSRTARRKVAVIAAGWGILCGVSGLLPERRGRSA